MTYAEFLEKLKAAEKTEPRSPEEICPELAHTLRWIDREDEIWRRDNGLRPPPAMNPATWMKWRETHYAMHMAAAVAAKNEQREVGEDG